ncbi:MAG: tetratricopeptide repeat protein [Pseudomonadota bacterium]
MSVIVQALVAATGRVAIMVEGGPGYGKTELTKAAAWHPDVFARFHNRRWFVALETARTALAMQDAVVRAIGTEPTKGFEAALTRLGDDPALVILDNLETPWEPAEERPLVLETLAALANVNGVALLASIRGSEWVGGAQWTSHRLSPLDERAATELFATICGTWVLNDPRLPDFLAALGGIPLAIELVARRAHGRAKLEPLWQRWLEIGADFIADPGSPQLRLTSLVQSIELSLQSSRLTPDARHLFGLLGRLPAGLSEYDRDLLIADTGFEAGELLLRMGLAVELDDRINLLPPIRQFARRRYPLDGDDETRWIANFLNVTRECARSLGTSEAPNSLLRFRNELPNIEEAFRGDLAQTGGAIARYRLNDFAKVCQFGHIPTDVFEEFLPTRRDVNGHAHDEVGEARCLAALAWFDVKNGNLGEGQQKFENALSIVREIGLPNEEAPIFERLAEIALRKGNSSLALSYYDGALGRYGQLEDVAGQARCYLGVGKTFVADSRYADAERWFKSAEEVFSECENEFGRAEVLFNLGDIAILRKKFEDAEAFYGAALAHFRRVGSQLGEANSLRQLGRIDLAAFDFERSKERYETAHAIYVEIGDSNGRDVCRQALAYVSTFLAG